MPYIKSRIPMKIKTKRLGMESLGITLIVPYYTTTGNNKAEHTIILDSDDEPYCLIKSFPEVISKEKIYKMEQDGWTHTIKDDEKGIRTVFTKMISNKEAIMELETSVSW